MSEDSSLKFTWRQLELEKPDCTKRLKRLRVKEELNNLIKQTQKMQEHDRNKNGKEKIQEQIHAMKKDQKQKGFQDNGHLKKISCKVLVM